MGARKKSSVNGYNNEITSEKVSVNMNPATLAQIDLLIDNGFYSNRSDYINEAVRQSLEQKSNRLERLIEKAGESCPDFFVGITTLNRQDFEHWKEKGQKHRITGYGILILAQECDDLILETISEIHVRGKVFCSERIRKIYLPTL